MYLCWLRFCAANICICDLENQQKRRRLFIKKLSTNTEGGKLGKMILS